MEQAITPLEMQLLDEIIAAFTRWKNSRPSPAQIGAIMNRATLYRQYTELVADPEQELLTETGNQSYPRLIVPNQIGFQPGHDLMGGVALAINQLLGDQRDAAIIRNKVSILEARLRDPALDEMHRAEIHGMLMSLYDPGPKPMPAIEQHDGPSAEN
jgi:hypothetical protein